MICGIQSDKVPPGHARSDKWPAVRRAHLRREPTCVVCGGKKKLEVHHLKPFHTHPEYELDPANLITLCENKSDGVNCHLLFGHLGSFKSVNDNCIRDSNSWNNKIEGRP